MDPLTLATVASLVTASVGSLTAALVSWQTYLEMQRNKKLLENLHALLRPHDLDKVPDPRYYDKEE